MRDFTVNTGAFAVAAPPSLAPVPESQPAPPLEAPAPPPSHRARNIALAVAVVLIAGVLYLWRGTATATQTTTILRTAVVERRDMVRTLRVNGTIEATQSYLVAAPQLTGGGLNSLVITKLIRAGTPVKKGDLLVEFDRQQQINNALDRRTDFKDLEEQIRKKQADQAYTRAKDDTELKQADDALRAAEFEMQRNEVVSKIDAEKNQENLEEAKARLAQLRQTYDLKRRAARSELRILEIQRDRARNAMVHAENNAKKMSIASPLGGVVVLNTIWKGSNMGEVQEGDEVRAGVPFLQVMDPNSMQVRAKVNQADVGRFEVGQTVQVRMDAYPDIALPGKVERIARIGASSQFSNRVRNFVVVFSIQGTSPRLMPDLSSAVDIELGRVQQALVVPRDALVTEGEAAFVWVRDGRGFRKQPIRVVMTSGSEAAIEGANAGDVVERNPPTSQAGTS